MTDKIFKIQAQPRVISPNADLESPLYILAWKATQRWTEQISQLKSNYEIALTNENRAWILLADECFRLEKFCKAFEKENNTDLVQLLEALVLEIKRLKQELKSHDIIIESSEASVYSSELAEMVESIAQVPLAGIKEPIVQEVLAPIIKRENQIIRSGKAIIAVPEI